MSEKQKKERLKSKSVFKARGINIGITQLDDGRFRFEASKNETRFSEAFSYDELMESFRDVARFMSNPDSTPFDDARYERITQVLKDYALTEHKTIEDIDRECQLPPARPGLKGTTLSREEYLTQKLGGADLEAVLAGEMTVAEAIRHQGEDEGLDEGEEGPEDGQVN